MDLLEIKSEKNSPINTLDLKTKPKVFFTVNKLTSSLPLTTDQILKIFINNNNDIVNNLLLDLKEDVLEKDSNCRSLSMKSKKNNYNRKCKGCQIITRLIRTNYLTSNKIEIFSGKNKNLFLKIENHLINKPTEYTKNLLLEKLSIYYQKNSSDIICDNDYYSTENKYYNLVINSIILNKLCKEDKFHMYNNFLWSFACNTKLTIIKKLSIYNNLEQLCKSPYYSNYSSPIVSENDRKLSKSSVLIILKQLVIYLKKLSKNYFIHGDPSIKYISYAGEKIVLNNVTYALKIIINLSPYSSMIYENKRFVSIEDEKICNFGIPIEKINVFINGSKNYHNHSNLSLEYDEISILFYKIGKMSKNFNKIRNNYGIPVCHKSFDFICFLISFMKDKYFSKAFRECDRLMEIWRLLWVPEEYDKIMSDLEELKSNSYINIFNLVKKYYIRFDALDYFLNEIMYY